MKNKSALLIAVTIAATTAAPAAFAASSTWAIDGKHSTANFKVRHMMVSNVNGTISGIKGNADFDGKNVKNLKVEAEMDVNTINTAEPGRDEHLKGADFFNVAKYPTIKFVSKSVKEITPGKFQLVGDLTMHGVTKEVAMDVEGPSQVIKDEKGNEHVGASAHTKVNRKDFGIEYNHLLEAGGVAIGEDVDITLDVEMLKKAADKKASIN